MRESNRPKLYTTCVQSYGMGVTFEPSEEDSRVHAQMMRTCRERRDRWLSELEAVAREILEENSSTEELPR